MTQEMISASTASRVGGDQQSTRAKLTAAERANEALRLRLLGNSFRQIAEQLGYANGGGAHKAVSKALKSVTRENATELREQELQRLDMSQRAIMGQVLRGNLGAIDRFLKIIDQRAKLTGLYDSIVDTGIEEFKSVLKQWTEQLVEDESEHDEKESSE